MPKQFENESVLHDWVHKLPFQMQALLLTAMRGPDGLNKHNTAKVIVRYLRGIVIKPAGEWAGHSTMPLGLNDNDFMWGEYQTETTPGEKLGHVKPHELFAAYTKEFWSDHDHYPHHFIMHLLHCAEVVGYKHPDEKIALYWMDFYCRGCHSFHMMPETEYQLDERLNDFGCGIHNKPQNHE